MARQYALDPVLIDLLYQSLETAQSGIRVYTQAVTCALNNELREEWRLYLKQLRRHEQVLLSVFEAIRLDPVTHTPGRDAVACIGNALVATMQKAQQTATRAQSEVVASECIVLVETKDRANWALLAHIAKYADGTLKELLSWAVDSVEDEVDRHLVHTQGWMRELWMQALGYAALLPPPDGLIDQKDTALAGPVLGMQQPGSFQRQVRPERRLSVA
jgi:hypothetical protein